MKVFKVTPRGYCKGVINALNIAKECAQNYKGQKIYILGMIVHNQFIVDALNSLGITTIDEKGKSRLELLDSIDEGIVIITAHGTSEDVFRKAENKGLTVVDATCKDVIKTHELIKDCIKKQKEVLYIGKKGHPESDGSVSISDHVHLIEKKEDFLNYRDTKNYVITNQTTMSLYDVKELCEYAKEVIEKVEILPETCNATTIRQSAMEKLPEEVDLLYVVGDPRSNNSNKLREIALKMHPIEAKMIESIQDITIDDLKDKKCVAVTSGASTPTYLTNQVIEYLTQFNYEDPSTYPVPEIDNTKILK